MKRFEGTARPTNAWRMASNRIVFRITNLLTDTTDSDNNVAEEGSKHETDGGMGMAKAIFDAEHVENGVILQISVRENSRRLRSTKWRRAQSYAKSAEAKDTQRTTTLQMTRYPSATTTHNL